MFGKKKAEAATRIKLRDSEEIDEKELNDMRYQPEEEEVEEEVEEEPKKKPGKPFARPEPKEELWSIQQVAVQTEPVIYNSRTKETYTLYQAVAELLKRTEE